MQKAARLVAHHASTMPATARRLLGAAATLTTPLLPDDYLGYLNPLWSRREPRGVVDAVLPETRDAATIWLRTPAGLPGPHPRPVRARRRRRRRRAPLAHLLADLAAASRRRPHRDHRQGDPGRRRLQPPRPSRPARRRRPPRAADRRVRPARIRSRRASSSSPPAAASRRSTGMLRDLDDRRALRDVVHVHLAPTRDDVIFGDELRRLAHRHGSLRYRLLEHHDDAHGLFTVARLTQLVPDSPSATPGPAGRPACSMRSPSTGRRRSTARTAAHRALPARSSPRSAGEGGTVDFTKQRRASRRRRRHADPRRRRGGRRAAALAAAAWASATAASGRLTAGAVRDLRTGEIHAGRGRDGPDLRATPPPAPSRSTSERRPDDHDRTPLDHLTAADIEAIGARARRHPRRGHRRPRRGRRGLHPQGHQRPSARSRLGGRAVLLVLAVPARLDGRHRRRSRSPRSSRTWRSATTSCTASGTGCATPRSTPPPGSGTTPRRPRRGSTRTTTLHHTYTNVVGKDNDLGYEHHARRRGPAAGTRSTSPSRSTTSSSRCALRVRHRRSTTSSSTQVRTRQEAAGARLKARAQAACSRKVRRQVVKDYVALRRLLVGPVGDPVALRRTLTANLVRNVWTHSVIICGHFPDGVETFEYEEEQLDERDPRRVVRAPDARLGQHRRRRRCSTS